MQRWQRWLWWLTPPYGAEVRRQEIVDQIRRWQDEERAAAVRARLAGVAEILEQPTSLLPIVAPPAERPLLTLGQAARTRLPKHASRP